eukprot:3939414-Rhodomonas_salina.1
MSVNSLSLRPEHFPGLRKWDPLGASAEVKKEYSPSQADSQRVEGVRAERPTEAEKPAETFSRNADFVRVLSSLVHEMTRIRRLDEAIPFLATGEQKKTEKRKKILKPKQHRSDPQGFSYVSSYSELKKLSQVAPPVSD